MKRKTNLFYTEGPDSKFLTFSNYAESMTGNFLSVDTKIFPSRFLCLSINNLNNISKPQVIKFLVAYYENKLAFLRDNIDKVEKTLSPFGYLIEALSKILFVNEETGENEIRFWDDTTELKINDNPDVTSINIWSADITEQDYNGIYTDIICTVDLNEIKKCKINLNTEYELTTIDYEGDEIYGWDTLENIPNYEELTPIFDMNSSYRISTTINTLEFLNTVTSIDSLKFNVIIPLYEVTDINYNTNDTILGYDSYDEESGSYFVNINGINRYTHNVPLGIWLHGDDYKDTFIEVERDVITNMSPVWSLLISTQFKPFPYSTKYEIDAINTEKGAAFATFSQVLLRLNTVLDKFDKLNTRMSTLETRIDNVQTVLNNLSTVPALDKINNRMNVLSNDLHDEMNEFKEEIKGIIDNIKWKYQ